jgi:hypothetical protein
MLNRVTINALLRTVIGALGAAVVIMLSLSAWDSWSRLAVASRAAAVSDASVYLFTALHNLRFDRAVSRTELLADRQATTMNSILREALEGRPQSAATVEDYIAKVAKVRGSWAVLEDLANALPLPAAFTQAREKVNRDYFGSDYIDGGMKFIKDALAGLPPAMTVDQQTAIGPARSRRPAWMRSTKLLRKWTR